MKRRVLFVCTANSARSLMAEALLRDMAGDRFEVASAGTEPTSPHPTALQVLEEAGISTEGLQSKQLAEVQGQYWDYVITLCEKASNECGTVCQPAQQIAWDFADPVPAEAFEAPQPKVSRHLATLRDVGLLATERRGQWIYYSLNPGIPRWLARVLDETASHNNRLIENPLARLQAMADRPSVQCL